MKERKRDGEKGKRDKTTETAEYKERKCERFGDFEQE